MADDRNELTAEDRKAITIAAGTGAAPPVLTPEGLALYNERADDARYLADHGIRLVLPE